MTSLPIFRVTHTSTGKTTYPQLLFLALFLTFLVISFDLGASSAVLFTSLALLLIGRGLRYILLGVLPLFLFYVMPWIIDEKLRIGVLGMTGVKGCVMQAVVSCFLYASRWWFPVSAGANACYAMDEEKGSVGLRGYNDEEMGEEWPDEGLFDEGDLFAEGQFDEDLFLIEYGSPCLCTEYEHVEERNVTLHRLL